jgi:hypothetical protein
MLRLRGPTHSYAMRLSPLTVRNPTTRMSSRSGEVLTVRNTASTLRTCTAQKANGSERKKRFEANPRGNTLTGWLNNGYEIQVNY